jgi:hypothetical protein
MGAVFVPTNHPQVDSTSTFSPHQSTLNQLITQKGAYYGDAHAGQVPPKIASQH